MPEHEPSNTPEVSAQHQLERGNAPPLELRSDETCLAVGWAAMSEVVFDGFVATERVVMNGTMQEVHYTPIIASLKSRVRRRGPLEEVSAIVDLVKQHKLDEIERRRSSAALHDLGESKL